MRKSISVILVFLPQLANAAPEFEQDWTGHYIGGNIGAIFNQGSVQAHHIAFSSWDGRCSQNGQFNSAFIGPQIGIQKQFESKAILGLEGDYTYNFSQFGNAQCDCELDNSVYDKFSIRNRYQLALKARLGYAYRYRLQPFFAAGVSFADLGLSYTNEVNNNYAHTQIRPGYVLGAGVDWAYSPNWNFRLEYFYNQYNAIDLNILNVYEITDTGGSGQLKLSSNNVRVAINYWF